jgi:hypothetical protein
VQLRSTLSPHRNLTATSSILLRYYCCLIDAPTQSSDHKSESAPFYDDETLKRNKKVAEANADSATPRICRYISKLEDVVTNHINGTLSEEQYPWMLPPARTGDALATATALPSSVLQTQGIRGNEFDPITNAVLAEKMAGGTGAATAATVRRTAKSKRAAEGTGAAGAAAGAGVDASGNPPDPFVRALEKPKPRYYVGGRVIVFVVGGITPAEIAAMQRISTTTQREVICGGTSVMTPRDVLEQLYMTDEPVDDEDVGAGVGGADE